MIGIDFYQKDYVTQGGTGLGEFIKTSLPQQFKIEMCLFVYMHTHTHGHPHCYPPSWKSSYLFYPSPFGQREGKAEALF